MTELSSTSQAPIDSAELLSHVFVIIVYEFDSPSIVLFYCLHTLAHRPDLQEQLRGEILTNQDMPDEETENDLSNYVCLNAFIKEVLRMNPTAVQFVHRRCIEDPQIQGYKIPKGN